MKKTSFILRKLLFVFYFILVGVILLGIYMVFEVVNIYKNYQLDSLQEKTSLTALLVANEFSISKQTLDSIESYSYDRLLKSETNREFELELRPLMEKYGVERIIVYRQLTSSEYEYYANLSEIKEYGYTEATPLDMKYLLEAVVNDKVRTIKYEYEDNRYRYDFFDEDLVNKYSKFDYFERNETDKFSSHMVAHRKLFDENNNFIAYLGVEINLESYYKNVNSIMSIAYAFVTVIIIVLALALLIVMFALNASQNKRILEQQSFKDSFTGLYNRFIRRKFLKIYGNDMSVEYVFMLIDIDHLEKVNIMYGHKYGDELIKYLAASIKSQLRGDFDLPIYLGADDFAVIIRGENLDTATKIAKRIVLDMKQFKTIEDITLSIGITMTNIKELNNSFNVVFSRADAAVYEARTLNDDYKIVTRLRVDGTKIRR